MIKKINFRVKVKVKVKVKIMDFDYSISECIKHRTINKLSNITIKKQRNHIVYDGHRSRCGYLNDDLTLCLRKSYYSNEFKRNNDMRLRDLDIDDLNIYCYVHRKEEKIDKKRKRDNLNKHILDILKSGKQTEFFISDEKKKILEELSFKD
jgi:hypothetical protein